MSDTTVVRNEELSRYEILSDGTLAGFADFRERDGRLIFTHTETLPEFSGQGLGLKLAEGAVADAVAREATIVPVCPFFLRYLQRNDIPGAKIEWPE